ncbi:MAG: efflux RND transporter periplasmic adaptor subunit [Chitinophagaceae bacterium]
MKYSSPITKIKFCFLVLFVTTALLEGCHPNKIAHSNDEEKYILPDSLFQTLKIDTVEKCQVINTINLTGQVNFNEDNVVEIYPLVSGTVQDIKVMLGDYVHKGQILAVVKSGEMAGFSNDLVNAKTNLEIAKNNLAATSDMYKSGLASQRDYLGAKVGYQQAQSALVKAQQILQINGGGNSGTDIIRSPISGFIVAKSVNNQMAIRTDNGNSLFTISDLKNVWVIANVYESNIPDVHFGDSVHITTLSYPGKQFLGKIDNLLNVLDPSNKVMKVRISLPNPGYLLKPQMFASVDVIHPENKESLCIPTRALVFDHSQNYILLYKSNKNITVQPVQVINTIGGKAYISGDIKEGDLIIGSQALLIYQELNS